MGAKNTKHIKKAKKMDTFTHLISETSMFDGNWNGEKKLIHRMATELPSDCWIHVSNKKNKQDILSKKIYEQPKITSKPNGLYFSKGDWIFHEIRNIGDSSIYASKVDFTNIVMINTVDQALKFENDYGYIDINGYTYIDWIQVSKKYDGFVLCPIIPTVNNYEFMQDHFWLHGYDVCTLVLWNLDSIVKFDFLLDEVDYLKPQKIYKIDKINKTRKYKKNEKENVEKMVDIIINKTKIL